MTTQSDPQQLIEELQIAARDLKALRSFVKESMESTTGFSADACAHLFGKAADLLLSNSAEIERKDAALRSIADGSKLGVKMFEQRVRERKGCLTWYAVNILQDNLAACEGTARAAIEAVESGYVLSEATGSREYERKQKS